jgi:predicted phosphodiesterase
MTGDIIERASNPRYEAFKQKMQNTSKPWFTVIGNHDAGIDKFLPEDKSNGGIDFYAKVNGVNMIGISTFNGPGLTHYVNKTTMEKLADFLAKNKDMPAMIFCHSPFCDHKGEMGSWETPNNASQLLEIFNKYKNVVAFFCGHDHSLWYKSKDNILCVCEQGFCEGMGGVPKFSFFIWSVSETTLTGDIYYVASDNKVQKWDKKQIVYEFPHKLNLKKQNAKVAFKSLPEVSDHKILEKTFGKDWNPCPGIYLPPSWKESLSIIPAKKDKEATMMFVSRKDSKRKLPKDSEGHEWYSPDYQTDSNWKSCVIPKTYWGGGKKEEHPGGFFYFRIPIKIQPEVKKKLKRCLLKTMYYRSPEIYFNGKKLPPGDNGMATYWNGMVLIPITEFNREVNILAVKLTTSGWGGHKFDFELCGQNRSE